MRLVIVIMVRNGNFANYTMFCNMVQHRVVGSLVVGAAPTTSVGRSLTIFLEQIRWYHGVNGKNILILEYFYSTHKYNYCPNHDFL